ncbi:hypothetical protein NBRC116494_21090 [Aurantivibrio plasticivorans]
MHAQRAPEAPSETTGWSLIACGSWSTGEEFPITQGRFIIGRDPKCNLILPSNHVSRRHAECEVLSSGLSVKDLGSVNGTFVNNEPVKAHTALPGDKVRIEEFEFQISGPNNADDDKTSIRPVVAIPETLKKPKIKTHIDQGQPRFKTRPTSPGNRIEPLEKQSSWLGIITGAGIAIAILGLGYFALPILRQFLNG